MSFSEQDVTYKFQLIVEFENDVCLMSCMYGYKSNGLFFLSRASNDNKELLYYEYALKKI